MAGSTNNDLNRNAWRRLFIAPGIYLAIVLARPIVVEGPTLFNVGFALFVAGWVTALAWVCIATTRPRRSYYVVALGSLALGGLLLVGPIRSGIDLVSNAGLWLGMTLLAAIWTVYYERSER